LFPYLATAQTLSTTNSFFYFSFFTAQRLGGLPILVGALAFVEQV
jgi:hypothetical protein